MNEKAKEAATAVLNNLVEALVKHFPPMTKAEARAVIREALLQL